MQHTPPGTHVRASVRRADGHVVLTVADDGPGDPGRSCATGSSSASSAATATAAARSASG